MQAVASASPTLLGVLLSGAGAMGARRRQRGTPCHPSLLHDQFDVLRKRQIAADHLQSGAGAAQSSPLGVSERSVSLPILEPVVQHLMEKADAGFLVGQIGVGISA